MDQDRFDGIARALASATSRRGALAAALAGLAGGAALTTETAAKRRRKRCNPACAPGQTCVNRTCTCDNGGTVCGANCCLIGQRCEGGQCLDLPNPDACIAYGEPCKNVGRPCCENLACGSGQGGSEVACWVRKTGRCTSTAECIYGTECVEGICVGLLPEPACNPATCPAPTEPQFSNYHIEGVEAACVDGACGFACRAHVGEYIWRGTACSPTSPCQGSDYCWDMATDEVVCNGSSEYCCCGTHNQ